MQEYDPDFSGTALTELTVDNDDPSTALTAVHVLLRFDEIFGDTTGRIPQGAIITSATLELNVFNEGDAFTVRRMLQPWSDTVTWNSLGGGVSTDDVQATSAPDVITVAVPDQLLTLDVRTGVQAWSDAAAPGGNYGWAMISLGTDGVDFHSSEGAIAPKLTVSYELPQTAQQSSQSAAVVRAIAAAWSANRATLTPADTSETQLIEIDLDDEFEPVV